LEALRSGKGYDLKDLQAYLASFTPKLCQHHWRPTQNPAAFIPVNPQIFLPTLVLDSDSESEAVIFPEESFAVTRTAPSLAATTISKGWWGESAAVETTLNPPSPDTEKPPMSESTPENGSEAEPLVSQSPSAKPAGRFIPDPGKTYTSDSANDQLWQQFILWGGSCLLVVSLVATFVLRNHAAFRLKQFSSSVPSNASTEAQVPPPPATPIQIAQSLPTAATPSPTVTAAATTAPSHAQISPTPASNQRSQAILELKKMSLRPNQASDLSVAIAKARKIQPGAPLYAQAQENIQIWSQMILDLAAKRAKQRQYADAIAAAELITKNEPLYDQAQTAIAQWRLEAKQYVSNQILLEAATGLIRTGQASSYNRAIEVAKRVPTGQPGFEKAQKSINQWSEKILDFAKTRAAQGDFKAAIETATLVPEVTAAYEDAQDAIQKWQQKVNR
jgi:hypothetical protein